MEADNGSPFDGDKRKLRELIENVDVVFELVDPSKHDVLLKFVKAKITGDARSKLMVRDLTHSWELVKAILEENYATRHKLDYYACKMFSARQGKNESIASWGNKIDELQTDLREAARQVFKPEEILGAIGLINHLGKACFIQGLSNERIQTIVRSRGESILLSQGIELSLEEESSILSAKERSPSTSNGPPLWCSRCNRLGHAANKCIDLNKFSPTSVKTVLIVGVEGTLPGIVGRDRHIKAVLVEKLIKCLGVSVETLSIRAVLVETLTMCLGVSVETLVARTVSVGTLII